ncbi:hypothetical protein KO495_06160 [Colwellia sp. D2M02]|uniref:hypothetical protein n=1 Tax=Colwellia sp. D2M02 TaxID=2841562 RepID=UPI001C0A44A3|nr:hypothetical protein [Colwellia sp. D2M02]MBU2892906.1 hypothetical protein [Colwellia sp. D2M02]
MMKLNKIVVLATSVLLSTNVMAQQSQLVELPKAEKVSTKFSLDKTDFGTYIIERDLAYLPTAIADVDAVIGTKGAMSLVKTNQPIKHITKGTLVRNTLTNELAALSGNISVLLKEGVSAEQLSAETGLAVVSVYEGTKIAVFKVTGQQDIIAARKQLEESGFTKVVKIEVLDSIHVAH